jgi:hypothetical protein
LGFHTMSGTYIFYVQKVHQTLKTYKIQLLEFTRMEPPLHILAFCLTINIHEQTLNLLLQYCTNKI